MQSKSETEVLRAFRPFARSLTIFNMENFDLNNDRHVIGQNLLQAIECSALFSTLIAVAAMNGWAFFAPEQNWNQRAFHLVIMLCVIQQMCIFTSMTWNNREILMTLAQLQRTVDNRERFYFSRENSKILLIWLIRVN